jgi:choline dehydrogenase
MKPSYDVIVIGSGSGGGVAAARLSENPELSVLLLEAGADFPDEAVRMPLFVVSGAHTWRVSGAPELDWNLVDRDLAGRRGGRPIRLPRGRVMGGTSMVNSAIAVRPSPADMDRWARDFGCTGWDWASLLPWFRRIETDRDFRNDPLHGNAGPIVIQRWRPESWAPVNAVFAEAATELGYTEAPDLNGMDVDAGVWGALPHNRFKEEKQGTLNTYLRAARGRPNLSLRGGALVDRVLLENGAATGVMLAGGEVIRARGVVVAGGVYNSPAILQRSGIGPAALLARHGIPVVADLPVGRCLTDHPGCAFFLRAEGVSRMTGRLFATTLRGRPGPDGAPPWHIHPFPADEEEDRIGFFVFLCRQRSVGMVEIAGPDPQAAPRIDHDYLSDPADRRAFHDAFAEMQALAATGAFAKVRARHETLPDEVDMHLDRMLASAHHQSGGCAMGPDPTTSVVSPDLAVHGVAGVWVADGSVFPDTIINNTNLTCYVIGERAADIVGRTMGGL